MENYRPRRLCLLSKLEFGGQLLYFKLSELPNMKIVLSCFFRVPLNWVWCPTVVARGSPHGPETCPSSGQQKCSLPVPPVPARIPRKAEVTSETSFFSQLEQGLSPTHPTDTATLGTISSSFATSTDFSLQAGSHQGLKTKVLLPLIFEAPVLKEQTEEGW